MREADSMTFLTGEDFKKDPDDERRAVELVAMSESANKILEGQK